MKYCSVPQCYSQITGEISMHYYPTNMKMQNIWRQVLCMKEPINKYKKVCNLHFKEDDFISPDKNLGKRYLKRGIVPSQNLPNRSLANKVNPRQTELVKARVELAKQKKAELETVTSTSVNEIKDNEKKVKIKDRVIFVKPNNFVETTKTKGLKNNWITDIDNGIVENNDEQNVIAKCWTFKLIQMKQEQKIWAEKFINDILTEAQLGTLHRNSVFINEN